MLRNFPFGNFIWFITTQTSRGLFYCISLRIVVHNLARLFFEQNQIPPILKWTQSLLAQAEIWRFEMWPLFKSRPLPFPEYRSCHINNLHNDRDFAIHSIETFRIFNFMLNLLNIVYIFI